MSKINRMTNDSSSGRKWARCGVLSLISDMQLTLFPVKINRLPWLCVTAGDEYSFKERKTNQSTCHVFVMICLIPGMSTGRGREGMRRASEWRNEEMCACVCLLGKQSNLEQERGREKVCLDQLLSKSVYSAQFGIKHNRLLSACSCLWCPIKMEFIAALRARPNHTFFPLRSVLLHPSLICTLFSRGNGIFCPHV